MYEDAHTGNLGAVAKPSRTSRGDFAGLESNGGFVDAVRKRRLCSSGLPRRP